MLNTDGPKQYLCRQHAHKRTAPFLRFLSSHHRSAVDGYGLSGYEITVV
jgi:hypothetical protein